MCSESIRGNMGVGIPLMGMPTLEIRVNSCKEKLMFCSKCGKELDDSWKSCPYCGNQVENPEEEIEKESNTTKKILIAGSIVGAIAVIGIGSIIVSGIVSKPEKSEDKVIEQEEVIESPPTEEPEIQEDFSDQDFETLAGVPESNVLSVGLKQGTTTGEYLGLNGTVKVTCENGSVTAIWISGDQENTPSFHSVKIGMPKEEAKIALQGSYPDIEDQEGQLSAKNIEQQKVVECAIKEDKVESISYRNLSEDEIAQIQAAKEEALRQEYIFPDSDKKYLSEDEVRSVEVDRLKLARNEIFARHGYIFNSEELQTYFDGTSWYQGTVPAEQFQGDAVFNDFEKKNIELIQKVEDEINGVNNQSVTFLGASGIYNYGTDGGALIEIDIEGSKIYVSMKNDTYQWIFQRIEAEVVNANTLRVNWGQCIFTLVWEDAGQFYISREGNTGLDEVNAMTNNTGYVNYDYHIAP